MLQVDSLQTFEIPLKWEPILLKGNRFDWHKEKAPAARDRDQLFGSKIYKWEFRSKNLPTKLYIGQCQEFEKRLGKYRAAKGNGKGTEARFQDEALKYEDAGGTVDLYFLDLGTPILINGKTVSRLTLGEPAVRLMLESIAIVSALAAGFEVVNQLRGNWYEKNICELELVKNLDPGSRREVMKSIGFHK